MTFHSNRSRPPRDVRMGTRLAELVMDGKKEEAEREARRILAQQQAILAARKQQTRQS